MNPHHGQVPTIAQKVSIPRICSNNANCVFFPLQFSSTRNINYKSKNLGGVSLIMMVVLSIHNHDDSPQRQFYTILQASTFMLIEGARESHRLFDRRVLSSMAIHLCCMMTCFVVVNPFHLQDRMYAHTHVGEKNEGRKQEKPQHTSFYSNGFKSLHDTIYINHKSYTTRV